MKSITSDVPGTCSIKQPAGKETILSYFNTTEQSTSLFQKEISLKQQYKQRLSKKLRPDLEGSILVSCIN